MYNHPRGDYMVFKISCGAEILLDDEDYNLIPKTGWYLQKKREA